MYIPVGGIYVYERVSEMKGFPYKNVSREEESCELYFNTEFKQLIADLHWSCGTNLDINNKTKMNYNVKW